MTRELFPRHLTSLFLATASLASASLAQTTLYTLSGDKANDRYGAVVASAGDFNNDGFNDMVVGAPEDFHIFLTGEGYARVISGKDGLILATFDGTNLQDAFGDAAAGVGDVNGDGWDDLAVGARLATLGSFSGGLVRVISGQTQLPLYEVGGLASGEQLGWAVSGCGDVDGDGLNDFVAGAPTAVSSMGIARVYSGATGSVIYTFTGTVANGRLGYSLGNVGDVNGDGRADILVGSLFEGVYLYSGLDGSVLEHFTTLALNDIYGKAVCGIDDMDGDGRLDIVIGATQEGVLSIPGPGYIEIRSSATGALLLSVAGITDGLRFGSSVAGAGDWNGDGTPDALVATVPSSSGVQPYAEVLSGLDGAVLATMTGDGLGLGIAGLGDVNNDGKVEVAVGAPHVSGPGIAAGQVKVYSGLAGSCGGMTNYCTAGANSVSPAGMNVLGMGSASVSSIFYLRAAGGPANQPGLFYYGPNQISMPFGEGTRCVGGMVHRLSPIVIGAGGTASMPLDFPALGFPIPANSTWNFQFWYRDPAGGGSNFNLSDAVEVNFCP
jgi:hypothetical protein